MLFTDPTRHRKVFRTPACAGVTRMQVCCGCAGPHAPQDRTILRLLRRPAAIFSQPLRRTCRGPIDELVCRTPRTDCTAQEALRKRLAVGPVTLHCGFDPTADSPHAGHLVGQMTLRRPQLAGRRPAASERPRTSCAHHRLPVCHGEP